MKFLFSVIFIALTMSSCIVSKKKYDDLNAKKSKLELDKAECQDELAKAQAENKRLQGKIDSLNNEIANRDKQITSLNSENSAAKEEHRKYQQTSEEQNSRLSKSLSQREKDLLASEKQIDALKADLEAREARLKELEKVLADKDKAVADLKARVSDALLGFKEKDLTINVKNGKVYVSLSEQLLFKSGSTEVDKKGVEALKKLAGALKEQNDISVMVEGHTDDVPISTTCIKDNWDLSVLRATEIVRILLSSGVNPNKLVPSGRSQYVPVAEGKTPEARQKNRRTEIILTPKLDELFQILDTK